MIKATELRIGNIVLSRETELAHFHTIGCNDMGDFYSTIQDSLDPIPLTPEIMEKCGFEADDDDGGGCSIYVSETLRLWRGDLEGVMRLRFWGDEYSYPIHLKEPVYHFQYLHQLQNLYFALTAEELNIRL